MLKKQCRTARFILCLSDLCTEQLMPLRLNSAAIYISSVRYTNVNGIVTPSTLFTVREHCMQTVGRYETGCNLRSGDCYKIRLILICTYICKTNYFGFEDFRKMYIFMVK